MTEKVLKDKALNSSAALEQRSCESSLNAVPTPERVTADSDEDDDVDFTHMAHLTRSSGNISWGFDVHPHTFPVCIASVSPLQSATLQRGDTIVTINGVAPESFADAMLRIEQARLRLALCVRRVPVFRPPTPPRRGPSRGDCRSPVPAAELERLLRPSAPAGSPAAAAVEALWQGLFAARHTRAVAAPAAACGAIAALALRRAPRQAVYDRRGCPFGAADGFTDAFHDAVQRAMTRMALARPAEWADDDAGDAVAWAASASAPGPPALPREADAAAQRDAEVAAHAAARGGPGAEELAEAHSAMLRAAGDGAEAAEREREALAERLTRAEAAAAELRAAYEAATAPARGGAHATGRRRPRQNEGAAAGSRLCGLPRPMAGADGGPRNARRLESGDGAPASYYLRLPTPPGQN